MSLITFMYFIYSFFFFFLQVHVFLSSQVYGMETGRGGYFSSCSLIFVRKTKPLPWVLMLYFHVSYYLGKKIIVNVTPSQYFSPQFLKAICTDVRIGLWRKLSAEELMLLNCGIEEDSWESLGLQGNPTRPS